MRQVSKFILLWMVSLLGTSLSLAACNANTDQPLENTPIVVWEYVNETAFDAVYPEDWEYAVL